MGTQKNQKWSPNYVLLFRDFRRADDGVILRGGLVHAGEAVVDDLIPVLRRADFGVPHAAAIGLVGRYRATRENAGEKKWKREENCGPDH